MANRRILTQTTTIKAPFGGWISPLSGMVNFIPTASLEGAADQYAYSNGVSLFTLERVGQIAPSPVFTAVTDSSTYLTALPIEGDISANGETYMVLDNGTLVRMTTGSGSFATDVSYPATTPITSLRGIYDMIIIKDLATTPIEYVLWTTDISGTGADVSILPTAATAGGTDGTGTPNATFFSSTLTGGSKLTSGMPHKMALGQDGNIYITNGSNIAQIAWTGSILSGTAMTNKIKLGSGWVATGITTWKGYLVIIGCKQTATGVFSGTVREKCQVWFWNMTDTNYTSSIEIQDNYANAIWSDGTQLIALTNGRSNSSRIWLYNGTDFIQQFASDGLIVSATPVKGSLDSYQNSLLIGTSYGDAKSYATRQHLVRFYAKGLHGEEVLTDGTDFPDQVGMVKNLYKNTVFVGVAIGSTYKVYMSSVGTYYVNGDFRTRLYETTYKAVIKRFRAYFSQFGSGASVLFSLFRGYTSMVLNHPPTATGTGNSTIHITGLSISTKLLHVGMSVSGTNVPTGATIVSIVSTTAFDLSAPTTGAVGTMTFVGSYDLLDTTVSYAKNGALNEYVFDKQIPNISSFYMNIRFNHASITDVAAILERLEIDWTVNILHSPYAGE